MADINDNEPRKHYGIFAKTLHWGFVLLFVYGIAKQVDDLDQLEDIAFLRFEILFAALFISLLAIRFVYMRTTQTSSLPPQTPRWQKLAAKTVHYGMYISLSGIAITGLLIGFLFHLNVKDGFLIEAVIGLHEMAVLASYWLIGIHIAAAIYHRLLNDGVWSSMVPFLKEK